MDGPMRPYLPELTIRDYNIYQWYLRGVQYQLNTTYGLYSCSLLQHNGVLFALLSDSLAGREATCKKVRLPGTLCWKPMMCQTQEQAIVQMNLNAKNYTEVAEPMSNIYGALYSTLATDENSQRKSMRYIGSCIGRVFYLLDKAGRVAGDKRAGRYNVYLVNGVEDPGAALENARRQSLAAANDLVRAYGMLDVKLNKSLIDNIMILGLRHAVEPLDPENQPVRWELP